MGARVRYAGIFAVGMIAAVASCREIAVNAPPIDSIAITPLSQTLLVGQTAQFTARVEDASGRELRRNVVWSTDNAAVASVTTDGRVTGMGPGSTRITASADGKSGDAAVTVNAKLVATVELNPPGTSLAVGDSVRFEAIAKASDGTIISGKIPVWATSDAAVAQARQDGWVRGLTTGNAVISATIDGIRGQADVSVRASILTVANVRVEPNPVSLGVGDTLRFSAIATSATGALITGRRTLWSSSNPGVAAIDSAGKASALDVGTTTITAIVDGVVGQATLTVTTAVVATVEVTPGSITIANGNSAQLQAILRTQGGGIITGPTVVWSTSNGTVATVDQNGLVSARAIGNATITATAAGKSGNATVFVVLQPVSDVEISPASPVLLVGDTMLLTAILRDGNGATLTNRNVAWSSSDTAIARIVPTGPTTQQARLIARNAGNARITAVSESKRDSVTARVDPRAEIVVGKSAAAPLVKAGDTIQFTLEVRNNGPNPAAAVIVTDTLPANATFVSANPAATPSGNALRWTVPSLAAGNALSFTVRMLAPASGSVRNIGAAVASTAERNLADNRATSTVDVIPADLVVQKSASAASVIAGEIVTFTIDVTNTGAGPATAVVVVDSLPANGTFVDATGGVTPSGNVLTWPTIASLGAGASVSYSVRVRAPSSGSTSMTNTAAATSPAGDANPSDNRSSVTVAVVSVADLVVTKSASASTVAAGDTITFSIGVTNNGPGDATAVVVVDSLPVTGTFVDATGGASPSGNVITFPAIPVLASGGSASYTVRWRAPASGSVTNVARVSSSSADPDPNNNRATASTTISAANIAVVLAAPASVAAAETFEYTITVTNGGPGRAQGITVTSPKPSNAKFISATGSPSESPTTLTWTHPSLDASAQVTYTVRLEAPLTATATTVTMDASAITASSDPNPANNSSSATTSVNPVPADVELVSLTASASSVNPGDTFEYTITVRNNGPGVAIDVTLTGVIANASFVPGSATGGGTVSGASAVWQFNLIAASDTITRKVKAVAGASGAASMTATVVAVSLDLDGSNNSKTVITVVN